MQILSQRDARWSKEKLGASTLTVGRWGCTTTAMSMLSDYFKGFVSPLALAHNARNYNAEGLVLWKNLSFPTMRFVKRTYGRDDAMIQNALKDPNKAVILQVDNGAHWVTGIKKSLFGNSYVVADPWDGTKVDVIKRYKNITGAAFFERV